LHIETVPKFNSTDKEVTCNTHHSGRYERIKKAATKILFWDSGLNVAFFNLQKIPILSGPPYEFNLLKYVSEPLPSSYEAKPMPIKIEFS
jgi:hypothetical protein